MRYPGKDTNVIQIEQMAAENQMLRCELKHMQEEVDCYRMDIERDVAAECGCVILSNTGCYQDFIGILINNGYAVEVIPIQNGRSLKIIISESEEK